MKLQKYCVKVYQEVCTEVTVIAKAGSHKNTLITEAFKQSHITPLKDWEYVPDSMTCDPEIDIQKFD